MHVVGGPLSGLGTMQGLGACMVLPLCKDRTLAKDGFHTSGECHARVVCLKGLGVIHGICRQARSLGQLQLLITTHR